MAGAKVFAARTPPVPFLGKPSTYFRGLVRPIALKDIARPWSVLWWTLPVGTGRCPSSSRVALSAITVRVRRPPHGLLDAVSGLL